MPDLRERFRDIDRNPVPDVWDEIERRAEQGEAGTPRKSAGRSRLAAVIAAVVALLLAAAAFTFLVVSFRGSPRAHPAAVTAENGVIGYSASTTHSSKDQSVDAFAYDPRSGRTTDLTKTPGVGELDPVWSADGRYVAFKLTTSATSEEFVIANGDFSNPRVIRRCPGGCDIRDPAWSPDDSKLAFTAEERNGQGGWVSRMEVYDVASGKTQMFCDSTTCWFPGHPAWSPDGTRVAFDESGSGAIAGYLLPPHGPIWVANLSTGTVRPFTQTSTTCHLKGADACVFDSDPSWSPDGRYIAYVRSRFGGGTQKQSTEMFSTVGGSFSGFLASCDSTVQAGEGPPQWSADGALAFISSCASYGPTLQIRFGGPTASHRNAVLDLPASVYGSTLRWSPNGDQLTFTGGAGGGAIYVVDASTQKIDVAVHSAQVSGVSWLPATAPVTRVMARAADESELTGSDLAAALGLVWHETPGGIKPGDLSTTDRNGVSYVTFRGEVLSDCSSDKSKPVTGIVVVNAGFYCVSARTHVELYDLSERLKGHVPTEDELRDISKAYPGESQPSALASTSEMTGQELVDALDLPSADAHCYGNAVELRENEAYCLSAQRFPSAVERWRLAMQIRGNVPSETDVQAYRAQLALVQATNGEGGGAGTERLRQRYHNAVSKTQN